MYGVGMTRLLRPGRTPFAAPVWGEQRRGAAGPERSSVQQPPYQPRASSGRPSRAYWCGC